jgi:alpha-tubulin suppressor-like RCC1 family protein
LALALILAVPLVAACGDDDDEPTPRPETERVETEPPPEPEPEEPSGDPLPELRAAFALGGVHSCDIDASGKVRCWGSQQFGQLGDPELAPGDYDAHRVLPAEVPGLEGVVALYAGNFHNCTLHEDHVVRCWGHDGFGQVTGGGLAGSDVATPTVVEGLERPVELALGRQHTCARLADRRVLCFGDNQWGQLGDGTLELREGMVEVEGIDDAIAISAGRDHTCALREDDVITCWGAAVDGELGSAVRAAASGTPTDILEVPDHVTTIAAGGLHTCLLTEDGEVYCWGANDTHQMGNHRGGEQDDEAPHPVRVVDLEGVVEIAAGARHTCGRKADGTVFCWGANHFGQLGDGTETGDNVALQVKGLDDATTIAAGTRHTCAHRERGDQVCWGANRLGQLGHEGEEQVTVGAVVGTGELIAEPDPSQWRPRPRRGSMNGMRTMMGMGSMMGTAMGMAATPDPSPSPSGTPMSTPPPSPSPPTP